MVGTMPYSVQNKLRLNFKILGTQKLEYLGKKEELLIIKCAGQIRDQYGRFLTCKKKIVSDI